MNKWLIHVKLLIVAIIWGLGWPAGRVVATEMLPFAASWIRYVFATSAFLLVLKISGTVDDPTQIGMAAAIFDWIFLNLCLSSVFHGRYAIYRCWRRIAYDYL